MKLTPHAKLDASQDIACAMGGGEIQLDIASTSFPPCKLLDAILGQLHMGIKVPCLCSKCIGFINIKASII